ncbi:hypothetical protein [Methylorubrum aminovorans]
MNKDHRVANLMADALLLERVAASIGSAALVYRAKNCQNEECSLWRMARSHRIQALLAYGQAAALRGCVVIAGNPEQEHRYNKRYRSKGVSGKS